MGQNPADVSRAAGSATPSNMELLEHIGKLRVALEGEAQLRLVAESNTAAELKLFASQLEELAPVNASFEILLRSELKLLSDRVDEEVRLRTLGDQKQEKANDVSLHILNTEFQNEALRWKNSMNSLRNAVNSLRTKLEHESSELLNVKMMRTEDAGNFQETMKDLSAQVAQHTETLQLLMRRERGEVDVRGHEVPGGRWTEV